jgi:hypothetical protein
LKNSSCIPLKVIRRFGRACRLHTQAGSMCQARCHHEMTWTALRYIPETDVILTADVRNSDPVSILLVVTNVNRVITTCSCNAF